jgi:ABC-type dipeptide/oligopeptide/nickel transport system ATPase subunit
LAVKGVRERNMKIIGISGKKGAGKTTVAEYLQGAKNFHECNNASVTGFFTLAKKQYINTMEIMDIDLDDQDIKDSIHHGDKTRRQMLQEYGCAMRAIWEDVWVENWKMWVMCHPVVTHVIAPDVRFPNEVKAIHDLGGKVIRLTRCPRPEDTHESETALDYVKDECNSGYISRHNGWFFDAIIDNASMTEDEANKAVLELVTERKWI